VALSARVTEHKEQIQESDIQCLGHLRRALPLLDRLHDIGCQRDRAGNRKLFFDDYVKLVLLYIWNPAIESARDLQRAVGLPNVAKALGVKRFSVGSFSESVRVFEPEQLQPIIAELAAELTPAARDPRLADLKHTLTLVDATVLRGLSRLVRCAVGMDGRYNTSRDGKGVYGWRLHTQFELHTFSPVRIDRTGARNAGEQRENNMLRQHLEAGRCYIGDGTYADRSLLNQIHDIQSVYVVRSGGRAVFEVIQERPLSPEASQAGVLRDTLVEFTETGTNHPVRRVELRVEPHPRRTRTGVKQMDVLVVYTNLLELPAELIGLIYQYRYTVELFFRVFKQLLGMRHLLNEREEGVDIQVYCTVMVCLLIQLISGKKPNKAMRNVVSWYLQGLASEQDVVDFVNKPDNTGKKLAAKEALWKKLGF
jgi:hypothetical protein